MGNIQQYINEAINPDGKYYGLYMRNCRELVKLIPVVGSWIDAHTLGSLQDNNLRERLENLEKACEKALQESEESISLAEIANINGIFAVIALTNLEEFKNTAKTALDQITVSVEKLSENYPVFQPNSNFKLITISGASATGKDCLLDLVIHNKYRTKKRIEMLRKFTTREPRLVDSKYYDFVSDEEFDLIEKSGNVLFPYYKRDSRYGFDKTHFNELARENCFVFCIFTHFESFPADGQILKEKGINHIAFLLKANEECLFLRSNTRLLKPDDVERRKLSIKKDLSFLDENKNFEKRNFDLTINNSDSYAKEESYNKLVRHLGLEEMTIELRK